MTELSISCKECGILLDELPNTPIEERKPCPKCGSIVRTFTVQLEDQIKIREFIQIKKKSPDYPSKKKLRLYIQQGDQFDHGTGKWIFKQRRIDKDQSPSWYFEQILDTETGKLLHHCSEPLNEHVGHGSAKEKKQKELHNRDESDIE